MKNVFITTLGCKVNQYESAALKTAFDEQGCNIVNANQHADIVVVNTCSVTGKAGSQSRQAVRQAIRKNPEARIVITGCHAETAAEELSALDELNGRDFALIGNDGKDGLVAQALDITTPLVNSQCGTIGSAREICRLPVKRFGGRTRAYLRVQDGCENFCTYCIVPYTRGPSRSLPYREIHEQAEIYRQEEYKEIVLTGIHLGNYGRDLFEQLDITDLVDSDFPTIRFRISSLEPMEITDRLLAVMRERDNLMPHLHIPLQSGCDAILEKMARGYTTREFARVVARCHKTVPGIAIGIDLLAGFPGETGEHFTNTLDFLDALPFTYLHVFPYSRRPGTAAADFTGHVPQAVKKARVVELRQLSERKKMAFYQEHLGKTLPVLVEGKRDEQGFLHGFTDNYIEVRFPGEKNLINHVVEVFLREFQPTTITGEVTGLQ